MLFSYQIFEDYSEIFYCFRVNIIMARNNTLYHWNNVKFIMFYAAEYDM